MASEEWGERTLEKWLGMFWSLVIQPLAKVPFARVGKGGTVKG
ncbi:MAG: hypothetical protein AB1589_31195 [Cyanobacteriota bacterium]